MGRLNGNNTLKPVCVCVCDAEKDQELCLRIKDSE